VRKAHRRGATILIAGAAQPVRNTLTLHGVGRPSVDYTATVEEALAFSSDSRTSPSSP
jgi:hypothetical protein